MEKGTVTIRYMQEYMKKKQNQLDDYSPEVSMIKLTEEVGELARVMIRGANHAGDADSLKDTVEEELCDVLYYTLKLANALDVDMETWIPLKEKKNALRYPAGIEFDPSDESVYRENR